VVVGWATNAAGMIVPFAGRRLVGCKTSARCRAALHSEAFGVSADGSVVVAGLQRRRSVGVPFAGRMVSCKTSARWAAIESVAYGVSADGAVVVGWAENAAGSGVPFAGRLSAAWKT
jgi:uncharacterized membrane protein